MSLLYLVVMVVLLAFRLALRHNSMFMEVFKKATYIAFLLMVSAQYLRN